MAARPQFDNKITMGTVINILGLMGTVGAFVLLTGQQADVNSSAIQALEDSVKSEVTEIKATVKSVSARLEREIDNDLDEVTEVVDGVDTKVGEVITEQRTSSLRISAVEADVDKLERQAVSTRSIAISVQSNASRDRAVQAERHDTLIGAIGELKTSLRNSNN